MPSPGAASIAATIGAKAYTVEGGYATQFVDPSSFVTSLSVAMDAGWTSASPTTATAMAAAFSAEFSSYSGNGRTFIDCVASGIDDEVAAWVASWDVDLQVHTYTVNAASIVSRIMACSPVQSAGAQALAEVAADAFMSGFGQEVG